MSSKLDYTRLTASSPWKLMLFRAPSAYEWCKFLDSSSGPQPNETWQDCPHHSGVQRCTLRGSWLFSRIGRSIGKNWARHHSHLLNPHSPRGQHRFRDWLDSSSLQTYATTKPAFRTPPGHLATFTQQVQENIGVLVIVAQNHDTGWEASFPVRVGEVWGLPYSS